MTTEILFSLSPDHINSAAHGRWQVRHCNGHSEIQLFALGFQTEKILREIAQFVRGDNAAPLGHEMRRLRPIRIFAGNDALAPADERQQFRLRSEEHTSELQSRQYLVCRLL